MLRQFLLVVFVVQFFITEACGVIGGQDGTPAPFQVSVQINNHHMCGGAIVSEEWIVTAAYCLYSEKLPDYQVLAGVNNIYNPESEHQSRKVVQVEKHPQFAGDVNPYDVAVIKVDSPFSINVEVDTIALYDPAEHKYPSLGVVFGWGSQSTSYYPVNPSLLQSNTVNIMPYHDCVIALIKFRGTSAPLGTSNLCTGAPYETSGFCTRDAGGPLTATTTNQGNQQVDVLLGIMSWSVSPCGQIGAPSVYINVGDKDILGFIKQFLNPAKSEL